MKQKVWKNPRFIITTIAALIFAGLCIINACKKVDSSPKNKPETMGSIESKFFNNHLPIDPRVQRAMKFVKSQNDSFRFVQNVVSKVGYPYWNKSLVYSGQLAYHRGSGGDADSVDIIYVPFIRDTDNFVNTTLIIKMGDGSPTSTVSTEHRFLCDWQYQDCGTGPSTDSTWNQKDVFHIFAELDNSVFDRTQFKVTDSTLLSTADKASLDSLKVSFEDATIIYNLKKNGDRGNTGGRANYLQPLETCEHFSTCIEPCRAFRSEHARGLDDDPCTCVTWLDWDVCTIVWEEESNGGGGSGGSGGNSGGGGWIPPTCGGGDARGLKVNCSPGWIPPAGGGDETTYENLGFHHFDNASVSPGDYGKIMNWSLNNINVTHLDSCRTVLLRKLIDSLGSNPLGRMLAKLDRAIFENMNIEKFQVRYNIAPNMGVVARTDSFVYNSTTGVFSCAITLDSAIANTATDIFVAGTLLHESIHAYMASLLYRVQGGATSLSTLQGMGYSDLFDTYIDTLVSRNDAQLTAIMYDRQYHHNYMVSQLLNTLAEALKLFDGNAIGNSTGNDRYYWYLAWKGLYQTDTWTTHWPNYATLPVAGGPYTTDDSTRGMRYALTPNRLDTIYHAIVNKQNANGSAKGRHPVSGGCY